jgi:hypothetical protein
MNIVPKEKMSQIDIIDYQLNIFESENKELEKKHYHFGDITRDIVSKVKQAKEDREAENLFMEGLKFRDK